MDEFDATQRSVLDGKYTGDKVASNAIFRPYGAAELLALCLESNQEVLNNLPR